MDPLLAFFINRVQRTYFSGFPIYRTPEDTYAGAFMKHRLSSRFEAVGEDCVIAELECVAPTGAMVDIESLQKLCRASQSAVVLDRFIRSVHLLNLMNNPTRRDTVFLPVTQALITGVSHNHGSVFRTILERLELQNHQFGILLPSDLQIDKNRFKQIIQAYQRNGFLTAERTAQSGIVILPYSPE